jgi:adenylosuccinate lyase
VDHQFLSCLAGVAASASKMANDIRLLAHLRELEEPFEEKQIGSSAMPYKRNPMRSERICALSRHVITLSQDPAHTAATQWLERSLDDSANKRLSTPDAYMATDAILVLLENVARGLRVNRHVVESNLAVHLPFMAMESVLMAEVARGGDRQELHEAIRQQALAAARRMNEGEAPELFTHVAGDAAFSFSRDELDAMAKPEAFIGRAPQQVDSFLARNVAPVLARYPEAEATVAAEEIRV